MRQFQDEDIKMVSYVVDALVANHRLSKEHARDMVQESVFLQFLSEYPEFVYHYNVEYWAKEIIKERKRRMHKSNHKV